MKKVRFADLHCHPNLKTFGHSFRSSLSPKRDLWYTERPSFLRRFLKRTLGLTRFSQCDLSTMSQSGYKLAVVSLYPFEKGFFMNVAGKGPLSAFLSDQITGISYERIRHIQTHTDYFQDLNQEYQYFLSSRRKHLIDGIQHEWLPIANKQDWQKVDATDKVGVIFSIEGAHVFNSGLVPFGRKTIKTEVLENIRKVKEWQYPPMFITFAHNFYNDLCGHARSLDPIRYLVDQEYGIDTGLTELGIAALDELLSQDNGRRILIDLKHMSIKSREEFYAYLDQRWANENIPLLVSHGAVAGTKLKHEGAEPPLFARADINFYDEELVRIGASGGLFAVQFDSRRVASSTEIAKVGWRGKIEDIQRRSATLIWNQIRYIAERLDEAGLFAWGTACIGSDFDGTINPLNGILTTADFPTLAENLHELAADYLKMAPLKLDTNRAISAAEIVSRFTEDNICNFVRKQYL